MMEKLFIVLIVVLAVVAVAQIIRLSKVSSVLSKKREEDFSPIANKVNSNLMIYFVVFMFAFLIWHMVAFDNVLLPVAASEHGVKVDNLLNFNWWIIFTVFFVVNFLLFFFARRYRYDPNRKAYYLAHNNTLELIWTIIPSIVLVVIIIWGLLTWIDITDEPGEDALVIELYAKQFDWTARYSGTDNTLGDVNFTLITAENPLGVITADGIEVKLKELDEEIEKAEMSIRNEVLPESRVKELEDRIGMRRRQKSKVLNYRDSGRDFQTAYDDVLVKGEMHIPVGKEVNFQIRARDVIHSAFMPHFRAQMNAVPGMNTQFTFTPTITTDSMRVIVEDANFNFILLCNKVCGSAHFNMQMDIIVDSEADYAKWIAEQKTFVQAEPVRAELKEKVEVEGTIAVN